MLICRLTLIIWRYNSEHPPFLIIAIVSGITGNAEFWFCLKLNHINRFLDLNQYVVFSISLNLTSGNAFFVVNKNKNKNRGYYAQ